MPFLATPASDAVVLAWGLPSGTEYIVILVVALLLFGKRLPEIMRGLGSSVREFKKGMDTDPEPSAHREPVRPVDGAVSRNDALPPPNAPPAGNPADVAASQPPKQH